MQEKVAELMHEKEDILKTFHEQDKVYKENIQRNEKVSEKLIKTLTENKALEEKAIEREVVIKKLTQDVENLKDFNEKITKEHQERLVNYFVN